MISAHKLKLVEFFTIYQSIKGYAFNARDKSMFSYLKVSYNSFFLKKNNNIKRSIVLKLNPILNIKH